MHTTITKWVSIAALLRAVLFWDSAASYQLSLNVVVSTAGAVAMVVAAQVNKYIDPKMPGHTAKPGEVDFGKALVGRLRMIIDQGS